MARSNRETGRSQLIRPLHESILFLIKRHINIVQCITVACFRRNVHSCNKICKNMQEQSVGRAQNGVAFITRTMLQGNLSLTDYHHRTRVSFTMEKWIIRKCSTSHRIKIREGHVKGMCADFYTSEKHVNDGTTF